MMNEKVSIIIPNYNREKLLKKAINSILNQTYKNIEIIIVDDYSTDNSKKIIERLALEHSNIYYEFLKENKGANFCRNKGVELSSGRYIAFLDSDDIFLEKKIEEQVKAFEENKNVGIIFTNYFINNRKVKEIKKNHYVYLKDVLMRNTLGGFSTIMLKKEVFIQCGGLDINLPSCQDWDLYLRVLKEFQGYYLYTPLVNYYIQSDSISQNYRKVIQGHLIIFDKIHEINKGEKLIKENILFSEQKQHLGDIYRRFIDFPKAKESYISSLKISLNFISILKLLSVSFGIKIYRKLGLLKESIHR